MTTKLEGNGNQVKALTHVCLQQIKSKYAEANRCQEDVLYGDDNFDMDHQSGVPWLYGVGGKALIAWPLVAIFLRLP